MRRLTAVPAGDAGQGRRSEAGQTQDVVAVQAVAARTGVSVTRPPGTSGGFAAGGLAPRRASVAPASQLSRPASGAVAGTRADDLRPLLAGRVEADLGRRARPGRRSCPRASPGCGPARRASRTARCSSSRRRATRCSGRAGCRPRGLAGGGGEERRRRCSARAPSRTARSRPWSSLPSHVAVGRAAARRPGGDLARAPRRGWRCSGRAGPSAASATAPEDPHAQASCAARHGLARVDRPPLTPTTAKARSPGQRRPALRVGDVVADRRSGAADAVPGTARSAADDRQGDDDHATAASEPHRRRRYTRRRSVAGRCVDANGCDGRAVRRPGRPGTSRGCGPTITSVRTSVPQTRHGSPVRR